MAGRSVTLNLVQFVEVQQSSEYQRLLVLKKSDFLCIVLKLTGQHKVFQLNHFVFQVIHHFTAARNNVFPFHIDRPRVTVNLL